MSADPVMNDLKRLLGRYVHYRQQRCQVIEILEPERGLVLRCENGQRVIQGNQFGEASRRVEAVITVSVFDREGNLDPLVRSWLD